MFKKNMEIAIKIDSKVKHVTVVRTTAKAVNISDFNNHNIWLPKASLKNIGGNLFRLSNFTPKGFQIYFLNNGLTTTTVNQDIKEHSTGKTFHVDATLIESFLKDINSNLVSVKAFNRIGLFKLEHAITDMLILHVVITGKQFKL